MGMIGSVLWIPGGLSPKQLKAICEEIEHRFAETREAKLREFAEEDALWA